MEELNEAQITRQEENEAERDMKTWKAAGLVGSVVCCIKFYGTSIIERLLSIFLLPVRYHLNE